MASGGVTARNTRQGFRSEYIAKYIFSAFGTAVEVTSENDIGLDLLCNLTYDQDKLIVYKSTYGIQVKSSGATFKYSGKLATSWLSKMEFPLLLVEIDKEQSTVKVYSTWNLNRFILGLHTDDESNYPEEVIFDTTSTDVLIEPDCSNGIVPVGRAILDFKFQDIDDSVTCNNLYSVLSEWLEIDDKNYAMRRDGVSMVYGYIKWETNIQPSKQSVWYKPYFFSSHHIENIMQLLSKIWPVLGLYHKIGSEKGTVEPFTSTYNDLLAFAKKHLHHKFDEYEKGIFDKEL